MKTLEKSIATALVCGVLFTSCGGNRQAAPVEMGFVSADSLLVNIHKYVNTKVETEGFIAHVCGVDGMKMKLMSQSNEVVVVIPFDTESFDSSLGGKRIRVYGVVQEERIDKSYIDAKAEEKTLLCHVDHAPCIDEKWVNAKIEAGIADSLSAQDIDTRRKKMEQQGRDYISIVSVVCEKYEILN